LKWIDAQRAHLFNDDGKKTQHLHHYCAGVWLGEQTSQQIKRLVDSAHYKALRIVYHDYKKRIPRIGLDRLARRATPTQWGNYIISKLVISTFHNKEPYHMYKKINETFYTTRRKPGIGHFYNNSRGKIGKQSIQNRLAAMDEIQREWTTQPLKGDALRTVLKKTFIPFDE